ncbi:MAG: hypothetical protein B7X65_23010 [Polaromonas sp. 39-63-25]|nr:MAG: hypothetical protein B7Y09_23445 [Polaromonas sp. 24-63-21]OZA85059.1 MAG: hypothetical protein B7X65_23010 [Polaromonas sp. 39-63-25]
MTDWPGYDDSLLSPHVQKRFRNLRDAVTLYMAGAPLAEVAQVAKVAERQFHRIFANCLRPDATGKIPGLRALVKGFKPERSTRTAPLKASPGSKTGFGGMFRKVLLDYPEIEKGLVAILNGYGSKGLTVNRVMFRTLHLGYIKLCRASRVKEDEYPLNTKERSRRALRSWVDTDYIPQYATRYIGRQYGKEAAVQAGYGEGTGDADRRSGGYDDWVMDEVTLDVDATYEIPNGQGDWEALELRRFQQLRLIHRGSGATLASRQIYAPQASAHDVSMLLWDAVNGPPVVNPVIDGVMFEPGAGYPAKAIPELRFAIPRVIYLDNALSHLADHVQHIVTHLFGGTVILGKPATPRERADVESQFARQAKRIVHQLPSTTGSGPKDPLRKSSAVAPKRRIRADVIEQVLDAYVQNENALPSAGSNHIPALDRLRRRIESGTLKPTYLPVDKRKAYYFCRPHRVLIKLDIRSGRRPFINYLYQRYSSPQLCNSFDLKGKAMLIRADFRNLRTVMMFYEDGTEFGPVSVLGHWGTFPHDVRIRRLFGKLKRDGELGPRADDMPLEVLFAHLRQRSIRDTTAALNLTYLIQYLTREEFVLPSHLQQESVEWLEVNAAVDRRSILPSLKPSKDFIDVEARSGASEAILLQAPGHSDDHRGSLLGAEPTFDQSTLRDGLAGRGTPSIAPPPAPTKWVMPRRPMRR